MYEINNIIIIIIIRPDIEMLGRLIQERDSIVVEKRGRRRPALFCAKQKERGRA